MVQDPAKILEVPVNWPVLTDALRHYSASGFTEISVPWIVPPEYMKLTFPDRDQVFEKNNGGYHTCYGDLVGSAEQSFLYMLLNKRLAPGRYVALTPCFRIEPAHDDLHRPYFAKVELFSTLPADRADLMHWTETALNYFRQASNRDVSFDIVATDIGYDIEADGIEIGSYNCHDMQGHQWICGTGMAEPRFSSICL